MNTKELLEERGTTHGDYESQSCLTEGMKAMMHRHENWTHVPLPVRHALDMILLKIGRAVAGDPDYLDHYDDIIGYAEQARRYVKKRTFSADNISKGSNGDE